MFMWRSFPDTRVKTYNIDPVWASSWWYTFWDCFNGGQAKSTILFGDPLFYAHVQPATSDLSRVPASFFSVCMRPSSCFLTGMCPILGGKPNSSTALRLGVVPIWRLGRERNACALATQTAPSGELGWKVFYSSLGRVDTWFAILALVARCACARTGSTLFPRESLQLRHSLQ